MYSEHASRAVPGAVVWHSVRTTDGSVLPDGCMDLVWRSGDVVVAGPDTQPFAVPGSAVPSVGLRLPPGVLPHVLGVPAAHLRDRRVLLADVIGRRAAAGLVGLAPHDAAEVFEAFVRAKLAEVGPTQPVVTETARLLAAGRSVADVADTVGLSARALHRLGTRSFGYGPKTLAGILRLQRARDLARLGTPSAAVAAECGYVDQAHLIRESRRITGRPFGDLRQPGSGANRSTPLPSGSFTVA
ncbi:helix-turn-helix domain-containing protein [Prescottella agglutinans]|uniref:AraC-like DNA-binding protein n=1 Tax=Prescottella agglutinans TaxID=1644129 RepID=A0ABT6M7E3_9NOCA|nr:helix-turn-helix domain-containing protein [Prescottella agglutinans]MDH6280228.1 AraC-like DNA-binding protein [Prescottella agglutinans]